jgi:Holliday junction resolvase-like predicted endonuclease
LWDNLFFSEPRRRKSKKQKLREKGRRSYRKGKAFEDKVDPFLKRKGKVSVLSTRVHSKGLKEEFDRIVADNHGRLYGVEIKATKQKVGVRTVDKFQKKINKHKSFLHGGFFVSKSGFTKEAESKKHKGIKKLTYKRKRKKKSSGWLF